MHDFGLEVRPAKKVANMVVGHLMKRNICTCRPRDSLRRAAEIMSNGECGTLPVVNDEGRLVGMVTDRDLCMAACRDGSPPESTRVASVACPDVVTVREDDSAKQAEGLMREHRLRRLPSKRRTVRRPKRPKCSVSALARFSTD